MTRLRAHVPGTPAGGAGRPPRAAGRAGFTMGEVIFAVIILGVGLILLAAAFPVGIKQTEANVDRMNAGLLARHAFEQITQVEASGARPLPQDTAWAVAGPPTVPSPGDRYAGMPITMGLLDGTEGELPGPEEVPDLRAKLLYPEWWPDIPDTWATSANWPLFYSNLPAVNPTRADGRPQRQDLPGAAVEYESDDAAVQWPLTFGTIWGYRLEAGVWKENLQWVLPSDRRYYWYAFYQPMYENASAYPYPKAGTWTDPAQVTRVRADRVTRRTFRVLIMACKVPDGSGPIATIAQVQARPVAPFPTGNTPSDYAAQWMQHTPTPSGPFPGLPALAPVRVPHDDTYAWSVANLGADTVGWVTGNWIVALIQAGMLRRGGIVVDGWGSIYQIADIGTNGVRLDRPLQIPGADESSALPLWFNPNAIAAFPTIVVKQADLP